jgi:hypothetical protein
VFSTGNCRTGTHTQIQADDIDVRRAAEVPSLDGPEGFPVLLASVWLRLRCVVPQLALRPLVRDADLVVVEGPHCLRGWKPNRTIPALFAVQEGLESSAQ